MGRMFLEQEEYPSSIQSKKKAEEFLLSAGNAINKGVSE